jgi:hypothetical protein
MILSNEYTFHVSGSDNKTVFWGGQKPALIEKHAPNVALSKSKLYGPLPFCQKQHRTYRVTQHTGKFSGFMQL